MSLVSLSMPYNESFMLVLNLTITSTVKFGSIIGLVLSLLNIVETSDIGFFGIYKLKLGMSIKKEFAREIPSLRFSSLEIFTPPQY